MKKIMIMLAALGFLLWIVFFVYMSFLWNYDKDDFWIMFSVAGIIFLTSTFWMIITAQVDSCNENDKK